MGDLTQLGNLVEACLWTGIAVFFAAKAYRTSGKLRRIFQVLAVFFALFGLSDLIESQTGAWWRPWWLLALKAACLFGLVYGFREYYRTKK